MKQRHAILFFVLAAATVQAQQREYCTFGVLLILVSLGGLLLRRGKAA